MTTQYLTQPIPHILLVATVLSAVCPAAAAQDSDRPPYNYDEEMLCRFALDATGHATHERAEPSDIANNTGVGGYYWTTMFHEDGFPYRQFWFYPWTTFSDDARQSRGVAVLFDLEPVYAADGSIEKWKTLANLAYEVGFVDDLPWGCSNTGLNTGTCAATPKRACEGLYPTGNEHDGANRPPLSWTTMSDSECRESRKLIANGPYLEQHPAPPGCE